MSEKKEVTISVEKLAAMIYMSNFMLVVDTMIKDKGHDSIIDKIPSNKLMDVFSIFGNCSSVKEVFKALKKEVPEVMPSANVIKILHLRVPFYYGMVLAHRYFDNKETIVKEVR